MDSLGKLRIELKLRDNGWADCSISAQDGVCEISGFGDCTDAFGDLLRGALLIATGAMRAGFSFDGEPMEWRWNIERRLFKPMLVTVSTFPDIHAHAPDGEGKLLLSTECPPEAFAYAVAEAAQSLLDEVGLDGFAKRWRLTGFPLRALRALQTALASEDPEPLPMAPASEGGWSIVATRSFDQHDVAEWLVAHELVDAFLVAVSTSDRGTVATLLSRATGDTTGQSGQSLAEFYLSEPSLVQGIVTRSGKSN